MAGLAVQSLDRKDLEVRLVHDGRVGLKFAELWSWMLRPGRFLMDCVPAEDSAAVQGAPLRTTFLNAGLRRARGRVLVPLMPGDRIHPKALERMASALDSKPGLAHANWLRLGPLAGVQRASTCTSKLKRRNGLGPRPAFSRELLEAGVHPRPGTPMGWDLALQAVQAGFPLKRVPDNLLTLTPALPAFKDRSEERRRARLVTANPAFFAAETLAWALAVLRHEAWALGSVPGRIPQPREVARLKDRHVRSLMREEQYPPEFMAGLLPSGA